MADPEVLPFATTQDWEAWLREHHETATGGVWIKFARKASGIPTVTYRDALQVALRFGWIDGQARGHDESWYLQRFTPRRARSIWSKRNRDFATALIEAGEMEPAGLREVERAKATAAGTRPTTRRARRGCPTTCRPRSTRTRRRQSSSPAWTARTAPIGPGAPRVG